MKSAPRIGWVARAGTAALLIIYGLPFLWLVPTALKTDAQMHRLLREGLALGSAR